jgi:hypothetical protein
MKNLFVLTEEEKNRILGLHESATKNQYLTSEAYESWRSSSDDKTERRVGRTLGFGIKSTMNNGCELVMLVDGNQYENLVCNVCPSGYLDFKIENDYKNTTITGNWSTDGQNVTIKMSDGTTFTGALSDGSIKDQVLRWIMKQPKFIDYSKKYALSTKGWGSGEVMTMPEDELGKWGGYPCVVNHPNAKQEKTSSGSIIYLINNEYYYNNGRKKLSDGTMLNYTCNDEIFKPQTKKENGGNGLTGGNGTTSKYYQEITDLQRKVGAKDDGFLGPKTLKKIMDKLSQ